ncbi:MAG: O-antigen ligase family protein [Dongiaceae bacterium]
MPLRAATERPPPGLPARLAIVGVLLALTNAVLPVMLTGDLPEDALLPDTARAILARAWLPVYAAILLLLARHPTASLGGLLRQRLLLALPLLAMLSALWSLDPATSLRRGLLLGLSTLLGVHLGQALPPAGLLRLLAWALGIALLLSLAFAVAAPAWGIMGFTHEGEWRGIWVHKNLLAAYATLDLLAAGILLGAVRRGRWLLRASLLLAAGLLVMSGAKTPIFVVLCLAGLLQLAWLRRRQPLLVLPALALLLLAAVLVYANADLLLELVGRDATLSSRTPLWAGLWGLIGERWLLGYGFEAFWTTQSGPVAGLWESIGWQPPNAHNGLLDLWIGLGLAGVLLFAGTIAVALATAARRLPRMGRLQAYWLVGFLGFFLLFGLDEMNFVQTNSLCWVLWVATLTQLRAATAPAARA